MKDYQRNQLEQLLRYREENRALYKKDLDKSLLDADDITAEELEMYIKLSTSRKNDTIDTSTQSI
jgi:phenylacetate-coenzyme A ligase PaaK-like adenylate-forming protein